MSVFLKMVKNLEGEELNKKPFAWSLICLIARRACRETRAAMIGDYKAYGMTEGQYRAAKKFLGDNGYCSFVGVRNGAKRGTVATLLDDRIFDINTIESNNGQTTDKTTDKTTDGTTDKNELKTGINDGQSNKQSNGHDNSTTTTNKNKEYKYIYSACVREFPLIEKCLKDEERKLFVNWMIVSEDEHGKKHGLSIDEEIKRLVEIPEDKRIESLKAAIKGAWKNIHEKTTNPKLQLTPQENNQSKFNNWGDPSPSNN